MPIGRKIPWYLLSIAPPQARPTQSQGSTEASLPRGSGPASMRDAHPVQAEQPEESSGPSGRANVEAARP